MLLLDDDAYYETKKIVLGQSKKSPLVEELSAWFGKTYSANVLNVQFSKLIGPNKLYRVYVIMENTKDYNKMYSELFQPKKEIQEQVALEFSRLALKYNFTDKSKLKDLFVIYNDFSEEAKTDANWKAEKEVSGYIEDKYSVVWKTMAMFSNSVVFYYLDADIELNRQNGVSEMIVNDYYAILKKYDELNLFARDNIQIKFDSKENVDKHYDGNLFYYYNG